MLAIANFTPVIRDNYRVGVPRRGRYTEILNTDAGVYGGSNVGNLGGATAEPIPWLGRENSIKLTLPPLAVLILKPSIE